jgi:parvulin-like peptidyl-prolyl isomerase
MHPRRRRATLLSLSACVAAVWLMVSAAQAASAQAPAQQPTPRIFDSTTIVAHVDGGAVTLGEVMFAFAQLPNRAKDLYTREPQGLQRFLDDYLVNIAFAREAEALKLGNDPLFAKLERAKRDEVLRELLARRTVLSDFNEEALRARYQANVTVRPSVRLRHILVTPVRENPSPNSTGDDAVGEEAAKIKAEKLRAEIAASSRFVLVAERSSEDASAKAGGDLGWVDPQTLVPELRQLALTLPVGTTSPVVRSALGFHIVEVVDRRAGGVLAFDAVRELLFQEMVADQRAQIEADAAKERATIMKKHKVEVHPDRLPW